MKINVFCTVAGCATVLTSGCIGYNSALFSTKSNIGLDVDTKPTTFDITMARREASIAPVFEGGQSPPVMASFRIDEKTARSFLPNISQTFAGGDAATTMTKLYGAEDNATNQVDPSSFEVSQLPHPKFLWLIPVPFATKGDAQPFIFASDTSFGLKIGWSGMSGQFPDTLRFGFHRKELSLATIFADQTPGAGTKYTVHSPSFLATMEYASSSSTLSNLNLGYISYFATGKAANNLALLKDIRDPMVKKLVPGVSSTYNPDANSDRLNAWAHDPLNRKALADWMSTNHLPGKPTDLIYGGAYQDSAGHSANYGAARAAAVRDLKVP